jgi:hypothetical protein
MLVTAMISLATGILCLLWGRNHWPGAWLVRGYVGDVAIVVFVSASLSVLWPQHLTLNLVAILILAVGLEIAQYWHHASGVAGVALGATFDVYDLLAYGIGAVLVVTLARPKHMRYRVDNASDIIDGDSARSM